MNILDESIIDNIKSRVEQPTVEPRQNVFAAQQPDLPPPTVGDASTADSSISELAKLQEQLASFPEIAARLPIRLDLSVKQEIDELCNQEKITIETLLEAFYVTCKEKDSVMKQVIKEAKKRIKNRKEAGNIRSSITRLANLAKKLK